MTALLWPSGSLISGALLPVSVPLQDLGCLHGLPAGLLACWLAGLLACVPVSCPSRCPPCAGKDRAKNTMLRELTLELDDLMRRVQRGRLKPVAVYAVIYIKGIPEAMTGVKHLHVSKGQG